MRSTLRKTEILRGRNSFSSSISKGIVISHGPMKCFVLAAPSSKPSVKAGFTTSKRIDGVARNQTKRRMREAYRLRKHILIEALAEHTADIQIVFLFRDMRPTSVKESERIDISMTKLLESVERTIRRV